MGTGKASGDDLPFFQQRFNNGVEKRLF